MALPAFKNGKPLFKNGKPAFAVSPCTCCGTCTCASLTGTTCSHCATSCTPATVEAVLSGIATACAALTGSTSVSCLTATLTGTFNASDHSLGACTWRYSESPGTTFNFVQWNASTVCSGANFSSRPWEIDVSISDQTAFGRGIVVRAVLTTSVGLVATIFAGQATFSDCYSTYVLTNGTGYDDAGNLIALKGGSGGTITLTFCP